MKGRGGINDGGKSSVWEQVPEESQGPAAFDGIHILSPLELQQVHRNTCAERGSTGGGVGEGTETAFVINRDKPTIIQTTRQDVLPFPDVVVLEYTKCCNIALSYATELWLLSVAQLHPPLVEAELVSPTSALHSILPNRAGVEMCRINFGKSARGHTYGVAFRKKL